MTAEETSDRQPAAAHRAIFFHGVHGIQRARRLETTHRRQNRGDDHLVESQQGEKQPAHRSTPAHRERAAARRKSATRSALKSAKETSAADVLRLTTKSAGARSRANGSRWRRQTSRVHRLSRFRTCAFPAFFVAVTPRREKFISLSAMNSTENREKSFRPDSYACRYSARFARRVCFGRVRRPRAVSRLFSTDHSRAATAIPLDACAPCGDGAKAPPVHPWFSSARESRESACVGGYSVERYASCCPNLLKRKRGV
jgi:hypothetical protein